MRSWIGGHAAALEIGKPVLDLFLNQYLAYLKKNELHVFSRKFGKNGAVGAVLESITFSDFDNLLNHQGVMTDFIAEAAVEFSVKKWSISTRLTVEVKNVEVTVEKTPSGGLRCLSICFPADFDVDVSFSEVDGWRGWVMRKLLAPSVNLGLWFATRIFRRIRFPLWDTGDVFEVFGLHAKEGKPTLIGQEMHLPHSLVMGFDFEGLPCTGNPDELFSLVPKGNNIGVILNEDLVSANIQFAYLKGWFSKSIGLKDWLVQINGTKVQYRKDLVVTTGSLLVEKPKNWSRIKINIKFKVGVIPTLAELDTDKPRMELKYQADIGKEFSTPLLQVLWGIMTFQSLYMSLITSLSMLGNVKMEAYMPAEVKLSLVGRNLLLEAISKRDNKAFPIKFGFPVELWGKSRIEMGAFSEVSLSNEVSVKAALNQESIFIQEKEFGLAMNFRELL